MQIVEEIEQRGDLQPWVEFARTFADDIITQNYALVMKWAQGHIKDRDLRPSGDPRDRRELHRHHARQTRDAFEKLVAAQR